MCRKKQKYSISLNGVLSVTHFFPSMAGCSANNPPQHSFSSYQSRFGDLLLTVTTK